MQSILTEGIDAMDSFFSPRRRLSELEAKQIQINYLSGRYVFQGTDPLY
jgi:hypothetical protein